MHAHVFEYWKEMFMVHINIDLKKFKGQWVHFSHCIYLTAWTILFNMNLTDTILFVC